MSRPAGYFPPLHIKVSSMSDTTCIQSPVSSLSMRILQALALHFLHATANL